MLEGSPLPGWHGKLVHSAACHTQVGLMSAGETHQQGRVVGGHLPHETRLSDEGHVHSIVMCQDKVVGKSRSAVSRCPLVAQIFEGTTPLGFR